MASMNPARQIRVCWLSLFLSLIFLLANGCSTAQSGTATNQDLEKYRIVYLVRPKGDDRDLTAGVLSRLKAAGFDASEIKATELKKLAAAKEPTLVCKFRYISTWDYNRTWDCFESIRIDFYDLESEKPVFNVNYFHPDSLIPEVTELNRLFIQIRDNFFPGQPNPFRENPRGPYGPKYLELHDPT